jgi:nucleoside-diphosphate-sugar epimerase
LNGLNELKPMRTLIVGCGYVGIALGRELAHLGHEVFGLRRTTESDSALKAAGIIPLTGDVSKLETLAKLPSDYGWVVNCVSSSGGGVEDYRRVYLQGTRNLLEWLLPTPPERFVYTSSTSVYGQTDGSLVAETSPVEPTADTARTLVETEKVLLNAAAANFPTIILRVAGIYGPGRGYWFKQFLRGDTAIEGNGEGFLNMVHRDDVVGAIITALEKGRPEQIYNVADNEPVTQLDLFRWLASASGKEMPSFGAPEIQSAHKRGWTNKRISNQKLKTELGYQFRYSTFRDGYTAAQG